MRHSGGYTSDFKDSGADSSCLILVRYADLHIDPEWWGFMGRRRRVLMAKSASVFSVGRSVQSISTNVLKMMQQQSWQEQQEQGQL